MCLRRHDIVNVCSPIGVGHCSKSVCDELVAVPPGVEPCAEVVKCCAIVGIVRREAGIAYSFTLNKSALSGNGVTTSGGYIQVVIQRFLKDAGV